MDDAVKTEVLLAAAGVETLKVTVNFGAALTLSDDGILSIDHKLLDEAAAQYDAGSREMFVVIAKAVQQAFELGRGERHSSARQATARPAYQQRVLDEREELHGRITRLAAFHETSTFRGLDIGEQADQMNQLSHMRGYLWALDNRIARFR